MANEVVAALERISDGVYAFDSDWRCTYANHAGGRLIGTNREDVAGHSPQQLFSQAMDQPFFKALQRAETTGEAVHIHAPELQGEVWFDVSVYPSADGYTIVLRDVTIDTRAEAALRASEALFRAVWEATSDAVALSDPDGTVFAANPAYLDLYGFDEAEVVGQSFAIIFSEEQRASAEAQHRALFANPEPPQAFEARVRRKDGTERGVEARADFVVEGGRRTAMISVIRDVTDRQDAEAALRASEERLRLALEAAGIGVYVWDPVTDSTDADGRLREMIGLDPGAEFSLTAALNRNIHPDDRTRYAAAATAMMDPAGAGRLEEEVRWFGSDGRERWLAFTGQAYFAGEGADRHAVRAIGGVLDITARKQAEEALQTSEERFRTLIQRSADVVQLIAPDGTLLYTSDSVAAALGYRPDEVVGERVAPYVHPDDLPAVATRIAEIGSTSDGVGAMEYRVRHKDGSWAWLEATISNHLQTASIGAFVCNFRNVTERKRIEREREAFVASAAHDLKTPLTSLMGQAQLLLRRLRRGQGDAARLESGLEEIAAASRRMVALIDEMMDAAQLEAGQALDLRPAPTDLVALVEAVAAEGRPSTRRHTVRVVTEVPSLVGEWDGVRLRRVLGNLLGNAIKYSPNGGEVVVRVGRQDDGPDAWAVVSVRDQGVGIPTADLPHIFTRFRRGGNVTDRISGTGVGLAGAARIVEQHGGTMDVESIEGQGSTFTLRLPLAG